MNRAQVRRVANAYTNAGLLVPAQLRADVLDAVTTSTRTAAIDRLTTAYTDLDRPLAAKLVDLAIEALPPGDTPA